ncbi:putative membrane protein YccC [Streptomyces canus]|uniref:hypothetical protein n=1 Tax=Streptomyces canus TaxID=58343 RepID=UPI002784D7D1|nr:hypothetical protein [Streptomyces canus]MDQ0598032.1 putative membrane protein YccC [Streptomyces canus]
MSDEQFKRDVQRFFWLPPDVPRPPARVWATLRVWLLCLAVGALGAAVGWEEEGLVVMMMVVMANLLDDVFEGVRHRWPAFVAALAFGWGVNRLGHALIPSSDSLWGEYGIYALWTLVAMATFVAVSRLPRR